MSGVCKKNKNVLAMLMALTLILISVRPCSGLSDWRTEFKISIDGGWYEIESWKGLERHTIPSDMRPFNENGTVMLPVRLVAEVYGAVIEWDPDRGKVTLVFTENPRNIVQFELGSPHYSINGIERPMLYPNGQVAIAYANSDGRMFVPMRYLGLAAGVEWDRIGYDNGIAHYNLKSSLTDAPAAAPTPVDDDYEDDYEDEE